MRDLVLHLPTHPILTHFFPGAPAMLLATSLSFCAIASRRHHPQLMLACMLASLYAVFAAFDAIWLWRSTGIAALSMLVLTLLLIIAINGIMANDDLQVPIVAVPGILVCLAVPVALELWSELLVDWFGYNAPYLLYSEFESAIWWIMTLLGAVAVALTVSMAISFCVLAKPADCSERLPLG